MFALVFENKVIQVADEEFPVHDSMLWVQCLNNTEVGWDVINGVIQIPPTIEPPTLSEVRAKKILDLAALRYQKETGGFYFMGQNIATDDRAKTLLIGARLEAMEAIQNNTAYSVNWKTSSGFVTLNAETIIAISNAVRAYIQSCFDIEKNHLDAIEALLTVEELNAYDINSGW